MSCEIVQGAVSPLLRVDVVDKLQQDFSGKPYLDKIYPTVFVGQRPIEDGGVEKFPIVYLNDGTKDNLNVMPDDSLKGYTFFEVEGLENFDRTEEEFTLIVNQIFWVNMRKVDDRGYDYTHELIADAIKTIDNGYFSSDITNIEVEETRENIFSRYDLPEVKLQQFLYPNTAFKLSYSITVNQDTECLDYFTLTSSPSDC